MRKILSLILLTGLLVYGTCQGEAETTPSKSKPQTQKSTLDVIRERGKLIAGVTHNEPPLGFVGKNGIFQGLEIDIADALAKKIFAEENRVTFIPVSIGKWIDFLKSGDIDILLAPVFLSAGSKEEIDTTIPCLITGGSILVEKDSKIRSYRELSGKTVATIEGTVGETIIRKFLPNSIPALFPNNTDALQALKNHRVDAFAQLDVFAFYMEEKDKSLRVVNLQPFHPSPLQLGVRKGDQEWRDFVNAELLAMINSGEYRKILDKWFGRIRADFLELSLKNEIPKEAK